MKAPKIYLWSFVILPIIAPFSRVEAQTIISDTTFNASDWSVIVNSEGGASQANMQEPTGGNPDVFRFMQHILPSPPSPTAVGLIEVAHIYEAVSYEPATQGAIEHLDYAEDTVLLSASYTVDTQGNPPFVRSFALVVQDGMTYRSASLLVVLGTSGWVRGSLTGLKAGDFIALDGSSNKPDFSESGAPLKFGFWRNHSRVGDTPVLYNQNVTIDHGIDNWAVTLYHNPITNLPPVATDDEFVVPHRGGPFALDVLANDFDPEGDMIDISDYTQPSLGSVIFYSDIREFELSPPGGGFLFTSFTYTITDGQSTDEAQVTTFMDCGCTMLCLEQEAAGKNSFSLALQDTLDLELLRRFRDEVLQPTEKGSSYVDIYYNGTPEIARILILDQPDLGAQAVTMVELLQPAMRSLLDGDGSVLITQAQMDTVQSFFANLSAAGSDSLQALIAAELTRVGPLDDYVGLPVNEVLTAVLGDSIATAIRNRNQTAPSDFVLQQNFPNPFNSSTRISYDLSRAAAVELRIYDIQGQEIKKLVNELQTAGQKSTVWNGLDDHGSEVPSGLYFFNLRIDKFQQTKKMILLR